MKKKICLHLQYIFKNANDKKNISDDVKKEMSELLDKLLLKFEDENFYYTMSVLYYIARK